MGDQFVVAAHGQLIRGDFRDVFRGRRGRPAGGDYRVFPGWFLIVGESERRERLAQVPGEVGGEHAQQHVGPDPVFQVVVNRPQVDVFGFHRPEVAFEVPEVFAGLDGLGGAELFRRGGGADDVDPVKFGLGGDFAFVAAELEPAVCDVGDEVLADFALVDDLAHLDPDLVRVFQPPGGYLDGDFLQLFFGRLEQGVPFRGTLRGQRGITAADQPLARVSRVGDLSEVLLLQPQT